MRISYQMHELLMKFLIGHFIGGLGECEIGVVGATPLRIRSDTGKIGGESNIAKKRPKELILSSNKCH